MTPETLQRARELYDSGIPTPEIARRIGYSLTHLNRCLKSSGWRPRVAGWSSRVTDEQLDRIERLASRNLTAPEIARELGLHKNTVARYMVELNVERQPYGHQTTAPGRRLFLYGPRDEPVQKWCSHCTTYKALSEFHRAKRLRHNCASFCKVCSRAATREVRARKKSSPPAV